LKEPPLDRSKQPPQDRSKEPPPFIVPIIEGEYVVPDFFVNLKPGCWVKNKSANNFPGYKCLVEVKSTEKDRFKIGGSKLQKLRNCADLLGHPLIFAVRFTRVKKNAVWCFVEDDRSKTVIDATIQSVIDGVRNTFWNEFVLTPNPNLTVICEFSKASSEIAISHPQYGKQIKTTLSDGQNTFVQEGPDAFMTCAMLETFGLKEIETEKIDEDRTIQVLKPGLGTAFLADLVYVTNKLIVDGFGNVVYDASKLLVRSDTEAHQHLITRRMIELLAKLMIENNLLFLGAIGDMEKHYSKWKEWGNVVD